jgi:hypothetical protein
MRKVALILFLLLFLLPAFFPASAGVADASTPPVNGSEDEKPVLENGRPVIGPLRYTPFAPGGATGEQFQATPASPTITVWYGHTQPFGHNGIQQRWVNVLGNVSGPQPITLLTYSLNNAPAVPLNMGPDDRRLTLPGDFIVELDYTTLQQGNNQLTITAGDDNNPPTVAQVTIEYHGDSQTWTPGSYVFEWQTAAAIHDLGHVVTGEWALDQAAGTVKPVIFDYDRLLGIGDLSWRDYTVTVPVTINAIDAGGFPAPSNGPGIGVLVRWQGHFDHNGVLPRVGWRDLGALAWYRWRKSDGQITSGMQLLGDGGRILAENGRSLTFGETYYFKVNIQSATGDDPATYRFKMWKASVTEPAGWDFVQPGRSGEPPSGSLLLLAHHVDAAFGQVTVQLDSTHSVPPPAATGIVYVTPRKAGTLQEIHYTAEDILAFDMASETWALYLDGSAAGLPSRGIDALHQMDDGSLLLSLGNPGSVAGLGTVDDSDIIRFVPTGSGQGTFEWFLDGSDVGLSSNAEDVDAIALTADQQLVISTSGKVKVEGVTAKGADLLLFTAASYGAETSGVWALYFEGADVGLTEASENIDSVWIDPRTHDLYLNTKGAFTLPGLSGGKNDVFICTPTSLGVNTACLLAPELFWRGATHGMNKPINGLDLHLGN